ncbi:MAG TPA: prepilin-type N-terminal cleavage/methylation domain-containing protein [Gemmatimonadales bacterium]|nr:prepilin-type N-terminal cleavage/methylation domain-containing protein [Gemmatimonadales bacterium]
MRQCANLRPSASPSLRSGTTLIELIVALAVLGIILGVSAAAIGSLDRKPSSTEVVAIARGRERALRTGVPVSIDLPDSNPNVGPRSVLLLPDGRVIGAGYDQLTGAVIRAEP